MRRRHANARQHAHQQDQREPCGGVQSDQGNLHHRPEGDPGHVGPALVPPPRKPLPQGQGQDRRDKDGGHDQIALRFTLHDVLDEKQQRCLQDLHRNPGEQKDDQAKDKGPVLDRRLQRAAQTGPFLLHELAAFPGAGENKQEGQCRNDAENQPHDQHPWSVVRLKRPNDQQGDGKGDEAAQDGKEHAIGGQAGALVIVRGQFRSERKVGHIDEGGRSVKDHVRRRIVDGQEDHIVPGRPPPEQGKRQGKGQGPEKQEGSPPSPARARAVRQVAKDGIVDVIPTATDKDGNRGDPWGDTHHVGQEDEEIGPQDRRRQAKAGIAHTVQELGLAR